MTIVKKSMTRAERIQFVRSVLNECRGYDDDIDGEFFKVQIHRIVKRWEEDTLDAISNVIIGGVEI